MQDKQIITFWNGNKSPARQTYELALLKMLLNATDLQNSKLVNDTTDYPKAEDEGNIFAHQTDILITVAGNKKFHDKPLIRINKPICKGLLGQRVLIIRSQDQQQFKQITEAQLKHKLAGIPATWVDADLFRINGYKVLEEGTLGYIFQQLKDKKCDYISLGINEAQSLLDEYDHSGECSIEESILLTYPLPLVFYIHPDQKKLATELENALQSLEVNEHWEQLFELHYGNIINALNIKERRLLTLQNPNIPKALHRLSPCSQ